MPTPILDVPRAEARSPWRPATPTFPTTRNSPHRPYEEPPRQHGCFFYGCIIASILTLLLLIAVGVGFSSSTDGWGRWSMSTRPRHRASCPRSRCPRSSARPLKERVEAFRKAIKEGKPTEPLVLNSDEINALIERGRQAQGSQGEGLRHDREGQAQGSGQHPAERYPEFRPDPRPVLERRGRVQGLAQGRRADRDHRIPSRSTASAASDEFMATAAEARTWPRTPTRTRRRPRRSATLESVEIKDGKLIITPRDRTKKLGERQDRGFARHRDQEREVIVHPPQETPAPKAEVPPAAKKSPTTAGAGRIHPAVSAEPEMKPRMTESSEWTCAAVRSAAIRLPSTLSERHR